jgi:SAM-dependent methyltransferase
MIEIWDKIWEKNQAEWDWDCLSEEMVQTLKREIGDLRGKKILEAGSGSGRISLRLAKEGAEITLLDYSERALEVSRKYFSKNKIQAVFIQADLTEKLPVDDNSYDIVWNGGVMEHFTREEQVEVTKEIYRISQEFHTFNPYLGSVFYRLGKWAAEKRRIWPYGKEVPIKTMEEVFEAAGFKLLKEYPVAHQVSLDFLTFLGNNTGQMIRLFLAELEEKERHEILQRMGGYLLYSKGTRQTYNFQKS